MNKSFFYVAKVTDNQDEDGLNRIKITTQLNEETVSYWIPYLSSMAGEGMGFSSLPNIDDQVLVLSMDGSRDNQIGVGSFWNENSTPPKTEENSDADLNGDGKNSLNFFKSQSGNMLIFDDTDGKEKIQLIASGGSTRIEFDNENELINMETDKDISISAKGNISIQAEEEISFTSKKALSIESEGLNIKSSKEVKIEASKDMTIKGSGIALN
jgi:uncharacterized protein involved in type VI secretion and phage assembly